MNTDYSFGKKLNKILKVISMDQTELSRRAGLTQAAVSQIINGLRDSSLQTIVKILKVIPVKFESLIDWESK